MMGQIVAATLGVLAFAILFHAPRRSYPACALCGGFCWAMYLVFSALGLNIFMASVAAVAMMTLLARVLSVAMRMPNTVFIVTGIFAIVPGASIYYSAYSLMVSDMALFQLKSKETVLLAGAIALGIIVGMSLPQSVPLALGTLLRRAGLAIRGKREEA
ncbi:MAG: threonine/serine exporter family protein [Clostridiales bacterium]|nr:threonine/serine exporter family protein [Clostridiales bacterium]